MVCLSCKSGRLRVVSAVTEPAAIRKILDHLQQRARECIPSLAKHDPTTDEWLVDH